MKTKTWIIYPSTRIPNWDSETQQLNWRTKGEAITVDLPFAISTDSEAQRFIDVSFESVMPGYGYCGWDVKNYQL